MKVNSEWKRNANSYFKFSKGDRNGIIVLIVFIIVSLTILYDVMNFDSTSTNLDHAKLEKALAEIENNKKIKNSKLKLFQFNPNTISKSQLDSLQLSKYIKGNLIKYRNSGGKFKSARDVKKLYGMNDSIFKVIEPYILIEPSNYSNKKNFKKTKRTYKIKQQTFDKKKIFKNKSINIRNEKPLTIELNNSTTEDLMKISGIGEVFSTRIIKYRKILGGFDNKNQLMEVYGISDTLYYKIEKHVIVDNANIEKIRINYADYKTLIRHPYLHKKEVSAIIKYRTDNGPYVSIKVLLDNNILEEKVYNKISPYFTIK